MGAKIKKGLLWFLNSYIWIFILLLAVDIITKNVVAHNMKEGDYIELIPNFLRITYSINTKAAFSIGFPEQFAWLNKLIYSVIAVGVSGFIIYYYIKKQKTMKGFLKACLMLVLAGAIGNLIDRLFYSASFLGSDKGGVVDFIDFYRIWNAIFNIADCCIVIAAIMLIIYFIVEEVKDYRAEIKKEKAQEVVFSKTEKEMEKKENSDKN